MNPLLNNPGPAAGGNIANVGNQPGAIGIVPQLDAATPLLLLPVNIETRFMDNPDGSELWVRIYPDQIAVNTHEAELTAHEIDDGTTYWNAVWMAGNPPPNPDDIRAPWRGLATLYGAQRAAWVALQMTPANVALQPAAPTAAGVIPVPPPMFPTPPTRASSWEKTPTASALPDAWTVVTYSGATITTYRSNPITPDLAMGITPGAGAFPAGAAVDAGMTWMADFDTAIQAGMALKIPLTPAARAAGFDRIIVYGLRFGEPDSAGIFADLLDAHHYTDGFSLVPQGAPTNNTSDASSAYSRKDPDYEISFSVERNGSLTGKPDADGSAFAASVGIPAAKLDHVGYADGTGVRNGTDMITALWPSTLGYFLTQMMADVFTPAQVEAARQYVMANAVARGPVPAFRIGKTPYGVLPTTSLRLYKPVGRRSIASIEPGLVDFLNKLLPTWLQSANSAPRMGGTADPDQDLVAVLGMDASSMSFRGRQVLGDDFFWNLLWFLQFPSAQIMTWWIDHLVRGRTLLDTYGFNAWNPRVIRQAMAESSFPVNYPTVQSGPLSETDPLKADANFGGNKINYITWLRSATIADIQAENYPGPKPTSLLYKILRQSILIEYARVAALNESNAGKLQLSQMREAEIVGVSPQIDAVAVSPWEVLARPALPNPKITWADYLLHTVDLLPVPAYAPLTELRASFDHLAGLPTAELDRLLTETLDGCSHRLDVWVTAVATSMLTQARAKKPLGTHLGSFGWVENIRPAAARAPIEGTDLAGVRALDQRRARISNKQVQLRVPVLPQTDNGGFIHAPSNAQAATAAILRNGYMTHKGTPDEGLLSIDLSSERVRRALFLLAGIRQGQSLNALLGYRFETGLHDLGLDKYIQPFRDRFPIVGGKLTPASDPSEAVAVSNVVDGLALRTAWDNKVLPAGGNWGAGLPGPGADQNAVTGILQDLDNTADAVGDLSIAESVFQIVKGNFGRAGGLMNAISKGLHPPDPEVVDTPRGGLDLTHRIALLFAGNPAGSAAWGGITKHPRAAVEPWLDAWAGTMLPDPATVRCQVKYHDGAGDHTITISLGDLGVGPLDVLDLSGAAEIPQRSEIEDRILFQAAVPAGADQIQINFDAAGLPPGSIVFPDLLLLAKTLRDLTGGGRALTPQDLTTPERTATDHGGAVDLADINARAAAALLSLTNDVAALVAAVPGLPAATDPVRLALLNLSFYGVHGAIPRSTSGPDAGIGDQAKSVLSDLQKRITDATAIALPAATPGDAVSVIQTVFGKGFAVLPRFTPPDFVTLQTAFGQSSALVASDPKAPSRWLMQLTHIRPGASRLDAAFTAAQVLNDGLVGPPQLLLGQLPEVNFDRWLGLPLDPNNLPDKGRLALACVTAGTPLTDSNYCGLLIDEWPERIPTAKENAAVAFHFEEPKARAPQSLLLAVCPDERAGWDDDLVRSILEDTLNLAKIRTVDLDSVQQVGQILPALYFALNLKSATISTHFSELEVAASAALKIR
jgi:hypothetical protein